MNVTILGCVVRIIVSSGIFSVLVIESMQSRCRYNKFTTWFLAILHIVITGLISVLFFRPEGTFYTDYTIGIVIWIVWAVWVLHMVIVGSYLEILFIILVTLNLYVNIMTLAKIGVNVTGRADEQGIIYAVLVVILSIVYLPALWYLYLKLFKKVIELDIKLYFWRFIWLVPAMTYMIFYVKIVEDYWVKQAVQGKGDILFGILWSFITYMFFLVALELLMQAYKGITAQEEARIITSQFQMQEGQYEKIIVSMEQTARLQHDWRHHLLTMNGFAENNDIANLREYLKELIPSYMFEGAGRVCENHIADAILQYYEAVGRKKGIELNICIDIPDKLAIADTDLCIIIGNLLENAMDACAEISAGKKYVEMKGSTAGKQLAIVLKNTYCGEIIEDRNGYYSTKHEGAGIGLSSVRSVVKKYNGIMKIDYDKEYFTVNILIRI